MVKSSIYEYKEVLMNSHRIWRMCRLAIFEEGQGKEDLTIASYYKRDYVGLGMLSNAILITVAYVLILGAVIICNVDFLIDNFDKLNYSVIIALIVIGYLLLLGLYTVFVFTLRRLKYEKARAEVKDYYDELNELLAEKRAEDKKKRRRVKS